MTSTLSQVAGALAPCEPRGADVSLVDATHDSRAVVPGSLFCAIPGARADGHDHAGQARELGAAALLVERWLDVDLPQLRVPSVRAAAGPAAAVIHGQPSRALQVVGITGTNGKTTTAYLLEAAFAAAGRRAGVIGTIETRIDGQPQPGVRTTPEGPDLQRLLARMRAQGVDVVAMEVSSHGLAMHRVDGTRFAVAVYTNLSRDHLDFHGTMEAYHDAKARLFTPAFAEQGVVMLDGPWALRLLERATIPTVTVGRPAGAEGAPDLPPDLSPDVVLEQEHVDVHGARARLRSARLDLDVEVATRLPGRFNLDNAALAVVAAVQAGLPADAVLAGVAACPGAPGRLERVEAGQPYPVLVDYAHTPDAVAKTLASVRALLPPGGRLTVVLGCGGDRDRDKRGPMGAAAAEGADLAVLTSDNPRSEDPRAILDAVVAGAREALAAGAGARVHVELDRRAAIGHALAQAGPNDVVVIAGKGHEAVQELADRVVPFDDRLVAAEWLAAAAGPRRWEA